MTATKPTTEEIGAIVARKLTGTDCTDDESAMIKRYFDRFHPDDSLSGTYVASLFTAEADEWAGEDRSLFT